MKAATHNQGDLVSEIVVWGEPPSAVAAPENLAHLSPAERQKAQARLLVEKDEERVKTLYYQPAAFSPPEVLKLLDFAHAQNGQPIQPKVPKVPPMPLGATREDLLLYAAERDQLLGPMNEETEHYFDRFRFWAGCDAQVKSQLAADATFNLKEPNAPAWSVSIPNDPIQPNLVIRAESAQLARIRYAELCGLWAEPAPTPGGSSPWSVTRHEEPAPQEGKRSAL
jgi:hypothetical protein